MERREMQVVADLHDVRLDKALQRLAPEFSRNYLQQLLRDGQVWLDGRSVRKPATKVSVGQHLALSLRPTPQSQAFQPEAMRLDIRYEDAHLLVLDKPAGLVVHPAAGNWSGTLLNGLLAYHPVFGRLPRAGIVHRLDKDTSGLMVVAKSMPMVAALVERIASREVSRQYLAVVHGGARTVWPWQAPGQSVRVDAPIGRDPAHRQRMAVVDLERHAGKPAQTDVALLARSGDYALVHCRLHTGRTHQIRVHMRHLGLPLVGDALYGGVGHQALQRQALHAWRLGFVHPHTGQALALQTALPADLQALLTALSLPIEALPA
nr:RluA family pseudouridine synthase [Corticibacter populi]